ncbi:hypothetical protein THAOC_36856 [Thalassiosira oceanica]|uniref:Uncharacterized protein n=1 Tax=Thalassiosira oceanica TaxID=159749 RepID=K0QYY8_THAOC|nr:hypothetical protein THAOC_36856 [Thalassiosira oceanica]|eukprot:EJK44593.1 hypothetical protein THAOC_36856 [Thalassiosira oceanica]
MVRHQKRALLKRKIAHERSESERKEKEQVDPFEELRKKRAKLQGPPSSASRPARPEYRLLDGTQGPRHSAADQESIPRRLQKANVPHGSSSNAPGSGRSTAVGGTRMSSRYRPPVDAGAD